MQEQQNEAQMYTDSCTLQDPKHLSASYPTSHSTSEIQHIQTLDSTQPHPVDLIARVLRTSGKRAGSTHTQAQRLLLHFGDLHALARASTAEMSCVEGITEEKALALSSAFALGRLWLCTPLHKKSVYTCPKDVYDAFASKLTRLDQETLWVVLLDQRNRVLQQIQVARGSINRCPILPQDVFAPALREKAVRIVLLHNHPSGNPEPSLEDRSLTRRLQHIAELIGIEILDHLIVGEQSYVSFADRGWL